MVQAKKRFGQHFLKEDPIAQRIVQALTGHGGYTHVIEVGPGTGALTRHLLDPERFSVTAVELDPEAAAHLRDALPHLHLVQADLLQLDLNTLVGDAPFAIIGNFPYNISTQIIFKVLAHRQRCTEVVGMFQKEVADRLAAAHGSKTYGITSVLCQSYYTVERLMNVAPGSFIPPPKVRSAVVRLQRNDRERLPCNEDLLATLVKTAFNQRRKTLHNALKMAPRGNDPVPDRFRPLRAEQLSVNDFIELTAEYEAGAAL
ncbi:MAG: ribosomal RNA small subunit methyltransferase A [Flavobacteriales bacterium]|nr:ribosomal RNA small subunit methyltransferase A [Flavobacteriales bacterium]